MKKAVFIVVIALLSLTACEGLEDELFTVSDPFYSPVATPTPAPKAKLVCEDYYCKIVFE